MAAPNVDKDLGGLMGPSFSTESRARVCRARAVTTGEPVKKDGEEDKQKSWISLPEDNSLTGAEDKARFPACHLVPAASFRLAAGRRKPMSALEHRAAVGTRGRFAEGCQELGSRKSEFYQISSSPGKCVL